MREEVVSHPFRFNYILSALTFCVHVCIDYFGLALRVRRQFPILRSVSCELGVYLSCLLNFILAVPISELCMNSIDRSAPLINRAQNLILFFVKTHQCCSQRVFGGIELSTDALEDESETSSNSPFGRVLDTGSYQRSDASVVRRVF